MSTDLWKYIAKCRNFKKSIAIILVLDYNNIELFYWGNYLMKEELISVENDLSSVSAEQTDDKAVIASDEKKITVNKKIIITASVIFILFLAVYISGIVYYSTHFYDNTTINGFPCSNMTVEEAEKSVIKGIENYEYVIFGRDSKKEVIKGKDVELKIETIGDLNEAKKRQSPWKWILLRKPRMQSVNIIVTLDEKLLYKKVEELDFIKSSKEAMKGAASKVVYENGEFKVKGKAEDDKEEDLYSQIQESSFLKLSLEDKRKNIVFVCVTGFCSCCCQLYIYHSLDFD